MQQQLKSVVFANILLLGLGAAGCTSKKVDVSTAQKTPQQTQPQQQQPSTASPNVANPAPSNPAQQPASTNSNSNSNSNSNPPTRGGALPPVDPNAGISDPGAPPVEIVDGHGQQQTYPSGQTGQNGQSGGTTAPCNVGCGRGYVRQGPVLAPVRIPVRQVTTQVPSTPAPVGRAAAKCQDLESFELFQNLARGWEVKLAPKLDLKSVTKSEQKHLKGYLGQDLHDNGRTFVLKTIYQGLRSLSRVNPDLACAVAASASRKKLDVDGPSKDGDKSPDGIAFKRHKFLWFGSGRILLGEEAFETLAIVSRSAIVDGDNPFITLRNPRESYWGNESALRSALFEAFLHFANVKVNEATHENAFETGTGAESDAVLACGSVAYSQVTSVDGRNLQLACSYCAHVRPMGDGTCDYDANWANASGEVACSVAPAPTPSPCSLPDQSCGGQQPQPQPQPQPDSSPCPLPDQSCGQQPVSQQPQPAAPPASAPCTQPDQSSQPQQPQPPQQPQEPQQPPPSTGGQQCLAPQSGTPQPSPLLPTN